VNLKASGAADYFGQERSRHCRLARAPLGIVIFLDFVFRGNLVTKRLAAGKEKKRYDNKRLQVFVGGSASLIR